MSEGTRYSLKRCPTCQRMYRPTGRRGRPPVYCSRACREYWRSVDRRTASALALWRERCVVCDEALYERTGFAMPGQSSGPRRVGGGRKAYCSTACRGYATGQMVTGRDRCRVPWRTCMDCDAEFVGYQQGGDVVVCPECSRARKVDTDRRKNYKRRSLARSGSYSMSEIVDRDGRDCHLCGRPVDLALSGNARWGPTIDHIVPISKGGPDVLYNVALAHRSCNCARGASPIAA